METIFTLVIWSIPAALVPDNRERFCFPIYSWDFLWLFSCGSRSRLLRRKINIILNSALRQELQTEQRKDWSWDLYFCPSVCILETGSSPQECWANNCFMLILILPVIKRRKIEVVLEFHIFRLFQKGWFTSVAIFQKIKIYNYIKMIHEKEKKSCFMITFEIKSDANRKLGGQEYQNVFKCVCLKPHSLSQRTNKTSTDHWTCLGEVKYIPKLKISAAQRPLCNVRKACGVY